MNSPGYKTVLKLTTLNNKSSDIEEVLLSVLLAHFHTIIIPTIKDNDDSWAQTLDYE